MFPTISNFNGGWVINHCGLIRDFKARFPNMFHQICSQIIHSYSHQQQKGVNKWKIRLRGYFWKKAKWELFQFLSQTTTLIEITIFITMITLLTVILCSNPLISTFCFSRFSEFTSIASSSSIFKTNDLNISQWTIYYKYNVTPATRMCTEYVQASWHN